jgi:hypothetical protein
MVATSLLASWLQGNDNFNVFPDKIAVSKYLPMISVDAIKYKNLNKIPSVMSFGNFFKR